MKSNDTKSKNNHDVSGASDGVSYRKVKFPLYVFEDTMKTVNALYKYDNCRSKTEFIEKAIRFYSGYVMNNKDETMEFIAPQIASIMEGTISSPLRELIHSKIKTQEANSKNNVNIKANMEAIFLSITKAIKR